MKKLWIFVMLFCGALSVMMGQRTVTGTVTDDSGEPLIGASVEVKDGSTGTVTDIDGKFELEVPDGYDVLVFSYVGFKETEMELGASNVVNVSMSESLELEEVVVTALGISREQKAVGYAVQTLDGDKLQEVAEPDPLRALQGKVAGVNINASSGAAGSSTRITLRGNSSLLGNNQALFVVDGIPFDNSEYRTNLGLSQGGSYGSRIGDIDPNNIEDVTILRGAAAAALWGSRAANGVVMITTKSGSGKTKKGLGITLSSTIGVEEIANLPNYQNKYGTGTGFEYQQANGSWGAPFIGERAYATLEEIPHWFNGRPGMEEFNGQTVPYRAYPDNVEELFRRGVFSENSLSISSGGERFGITSVLSYTKQEGYVPNTDYTRFNFSVGGNAQITDKFRINSKLDMTYSEQNGVISGVGSLGGNNSSAFARSLLLGRNWDVHGQPFQNPSDGGSEFMISRGQADNPLWSYRNAGFTSNVNRVNGLALFSYDILNNVTVNYRIGMNQYDQTNIEFTRPGSTGPSDNPGLGQVIDHRINFQEIESNFFITSRFDLTNKLNLTSTIGHNVNSRSTKQNAYRGTDYVVFDIDQVFNTNNIVKYDLPSGNDGLLRRRLIGVYGDLSFSYDNWAYLNVSGRNDWSSTLPKENRSYFYPAISGSISVMDALGYNSNNIDFLKLRAGYAEVGADADPYLLNTIYNTNSTLVTNPAPTANFPFDGTAGATLSDAAGNPNLKPERTKEWEVGFDLNAFRNRIDLGATYYDRTTEDQIVPVSVAESTGFVQFIDNLGEVRNRGVEVNLGLTPVSTKSGFTWNINTVFTRNINTVERLRDGLDEIQIETGSSFAGSVIGVFREGEEYGVLKGSINARYEGQLLVNPTNGQLIPVDSLAIIGNPNPDFTVGLTNTFSFKGFSLGVLWDWTEGGDIFSNQVQSMLGRGVLAFQGDRERNAVISGIYGNPTTLEPYLTEDGEVIQNQTMIEENDLWFGNTFASNGQDEWSVYDATVFRIREASLSYVFPKSVLGDKSFVKGLKLSVVGRNLWFFAPGMPEDSNFDPEVSQFGASTNKRGIEYGATPSLRRFAFNARVTF